MYIFVIVFLSLQMWVSDGLLSSSVPLVIIVDDLNDHAPVFGSVSDVTVDPHLQVGSVVTNITATDADVSQQNSEVTYFILGGGLDKFSIDSKSGQ